MVIIFLVLWSVCSSLVHFKNGLKYLTKGTAQVFIPLINFLQYSFVTSSSLVLLKYSFFLFYLHLFDGVSFQYPQAFVGYLYSAFLFFLDLVVLFRPLGVVCCFSLAHFLCQIPSLTVYSHCVY